MTLGAAVGGVPPTVPLFTLAPSLQMKLTPMLLIMFAARYLRFAACCALGSLQWHPVDGTTTWSAAIYNAVGRQIGGQPSVRDYASIVANTTRNASVQ